MKNRSYTIHFIQSARWLRAGRWYLTGLYFSLFLLHFSLTKGQTREQLIGTWIGVHTEMNVDFHCPLSAYIRLNADSSYHLGMVDGSATDVKSTWAVEGGRVRLDTIRFAPRLVTLQNDLLRIGTNYPQVFRRFSDVPADSAAVYEQLTGRVWQSASLSLYLHVNGQAGVEDRATHQRTAHFWKLARLEQSVFLIIFGNQHNREGGTKPLWQITAVGPRQLQAIGWNGCSVATETFQVVRTMAPGEVCQPTGFQPCDNCFHPMWHQIPINHTSRQYELTKLLTSSYQPVQHKEQSGLLTISFAVNCAGQSGLFTSKGVGEDYCPKTFDTDLTNQLLAICRKYIAVNSFLHPGQNLNEKAIDTAVSLTFRLKDGQIADILP